MNKLEKLHLEAIKQFEHHCTPLKDFASKSAEITEDIAIEFAEWLDTSETASNYWRQNRIKLEPKMDGSHNAKIKDARKELFQEFLKLKQ